MERSVLDILCFSWWVSRETQYSLFFLRMYLTRETFLNSCNWHVFKHLCFLFPCFFLIKNPWFVSSENLPLSFLFYKFSCSTNESHKRIVLPLGQRREEKITRCVNLFHSYQGLMAKKYAKRVHVWYIVCLYYDSDKMTYFH